jgi:hypothetical protein
MTTAEVVYIVLQQPGGDFRYRCPGRLWQMMLSWASYILRLQNDDATQQVGRVKQANQQRLSIPLCYRLGPADDS